jgi:alkyldihydroxyacetonephosphate synthase
MSIDTEAIITELAAVVGATHVSSAPDDVQAYGGLEPFVVVWPAAPPEVARVLRVCRDHGVAVGTAGYGARARTHWPVANGVLRVALDTRRMTNILDLDEVALTVNCQCGIRVHHLEEALNRQGLTLGPYPVEIQVSTLGGLVSAPSPTAHSPQTGWLDEACLALSVALPDGNLVHTRVAPRKATGPDVARFFIGSRGGLGVITTATLRVHRLPEKLQPLALAAPDLAAAVACAGRLLGQGLRPARLRVLGKRRVAQELGEVGSPAGAVLLAVLSGPEARLAVEAQLLTEALLQAGGRELPREVAERWWARQSAWNEPPSPRPHQVGARVLHSRFADVLQAMPGSVRRQSLQLWVEELSPQGGTLWLSCPQLKRPDEPLRSLLLNAGLDPIRFNFPPLMDELLGQLDPQGTMVVMEGEWSGT